MLYIPSGWYHAVLNLEFSAAISQNFLAPRALPAIWPRLSAEYRAFALALRDLLAISASPLCPALAASLPPPSPPLGPPPHDAPTVDLALCWSEVPTARPCAAPGAAPGAAPADAAPAAWLLVEEAWLLTQLEARPAAAAVLREGEAAMRRLYSYHDHLGALARAAAAHGAALCLVMSSERSSGTAAAEAALVEHGVPPAARVTLPPGDGAAAAWAAARGARRWALLSQDARPFHLAVALHQLPAEEARVGLQLDAEARGAFLVAAVRCAQDEALLRLPLSACIAPQDLRPCDAPLAAALADAHADADASASADTGDGAGASADGAAAAAARPASPAEQLLVAFLSLLARHEAGEAVDARACYFLQAVPPGFFREAPLLGAWADEAPHASQLRHSVAWRRSRAWRAHVERERLALAAAGLEVGAERYLWAKLLVHTRARTPLIRRGAGAGAGEGEDEGEEGGKEGSEARGESEGDEAGPFLCPLVELASHLSLGPTASLELEGSELVLRGRFVLDPGDEVSVSYSDGDYLDIFEQFGFFDAAATTHTAEVRVQDEQLLGIEVFGIEGGAGSDRGANAGGGRGGGGGDGGGGGCEAWRRELVEVARAQGCDAAHGAWWVPDFNLGACPLFAAVRATLLPAAQREAAAADASLLQRPLVPAALEAAARAKLAALLSAHLAGYATSLAQDETKLHERGSTLRSVQLAALRLVLFEKQLLAAALRELHDVPAAA